MLKEQGPEYGKGYTHFKRLRLASGFAVGLALAACAPEQKASPTPTEPKLTPTPIATEVPSPTPESTLTPTPEATPTPEPEFRFEPYGVYVGDIGGGGRVVLAALPDGRLAFASVKPEPYCSTYVYLFSAMGRYEEDGFSFTGPHPMFQHRVRGRLVDATTVSGEITPDLVATPSGTCGGETVGFMASLVGNGREEFLGEFRVTVEEEAPGYGLDSLEEAEALFDAFCAPHTCRLP